jgi:hypothetical protein
MDLESALILGVVPFLAGVGTLVYVWWCWSGRSRRWARRVFGNVLVLSVLPAWGGILIALAVKLVISDRIGGFLLWTAITVGWLGIIALGFEMLGFRPRWWGPRWYHDLDARNPQPDLSHGPTAVLISSTVPAPFSSDLEAAPAFGEPRVARWRAQYVYDPDDGRRAHALAPPGGVAGHLTLHQSGLTFAATATEDSMRDGPMVLVVPASEVVQARVVPARAGADGVVRKGWYRRSLFPRLVVDTRSGSLLFEVAGASRKAAKIVETLGRQPP